MFRSASRFCIVALLATVASAQQIQVRMNSRLASDSTRPGTAFEGVLVNPVQIGGQSCAKGSPVGGVVTESKKSGRLTNSGMLQLEPSWISCHGRKMSVSAEPVVLEGRSHTKKNAVLIGGGAGAGAVIGGIAGGGKGAAIGAAVGAGVGTIGAAATGKHEAVIEPEAIVAWNLNQSTTRPSRDERYAHSAPHTAPEADRRRREHDDDRDDDDDDDRYEDRREGNHGYREVRFTEHDRVYLSRCLSSNYRLPPGLAKKGKIPPGHAKKMQRAGYAIPYECTAELSPVPHGWERVIIDARVVLFDPGRREMDSFIWQRDGDRD